MILSLFSIKKTTRTVIIILLFHNVADAKYSGEIEIQGKIKNFKERAVQMIFRWKADGKYFKDSCDVKNSSYIFKTKISEPTMFSLQPKYMSKTGNPYYKTVDDSREGISFFLEPKKINLTTNGSLTNTICTGSQSNTVYVNSWKGEKSTTELETEASKIFQSLNLSKDDSLDIIEKISDSLRLIQEVEHFKKYAKTVLGPFLLNNLYDERFSVHKLKELFNLLSEECKLTSSAQILLKNLNLYTPLTLGGYLEWITMADTSGKAINISSVEYKLMLIDLWASWCVPCRQQTPELKQIYNDFQTKGFEVVGISLDDKAESWIKAIVEDKLPWINVSDLKGWNNELIIKSYIQSIPFNILIDKNGKIIAIDISMDELAKKCRDVLPGL